MTTHPNRSRRRADPDRNPLPAEVRAARLRAGLTQDAAALLVHSTLTAYQDYEYGRRRMHPGLWDLFQRKLSETANG